MSGFGMIGRIAMTAGFACLVLAASGPAAAQSYTPPLSVDQIRYCTCLQEHIQSMRPEMEARQAMAQERQRQLALLEAEIGAMQASMDPNDQAAQEQLKRKIYEANQIRDMLRRDLGPAEMASARTFNQSVRSYNEICANRRMVNVDVKEAMSNLDCSAITVP